MKTGGRQWTSTSSSHLFPLTDGPAVSSLSPSPALRPPPSPPSSPDGKPTPIGDGPRLSSTASPSKRRTPSARTQVLRGFVDPESPVEWADLVATIHDERLASDRQCKALLDTLAIVCLALVSAGLIAVAIFLTTTHAFSHAEVANRDTKVGMDGAWE